MPDQTSPAACMTAVRYDDHYYRVGQIDARIGRKGAFWVPVNPRHARAYRAGYASVVAQAA
jgi:hypothetical protein